MKTAAVIYATREGHTTLVTRCAARLLRDLGIGVDVMRLRDDEPDMRLGDYSAVILASSVHFQKHERAMVRFVRQHRGELEAMPAAFLSVNLSQAGLEVTEATPEQRAHAVAGVHEILDRFYAETGWYPEHVLSVAGALLYTRYNFLVRFVLKQIAKRGGGSTDTSRDHIYTNWNALESFVGRFAEAANLTTVHHFGPRAFT